MGSHYEGRGEGYGPSLSAVLASPSSVSTEEAFIGIGSNLGDRLSFCREAVRRLLAAPSLSIVAVSSLYETEPMAYLHQGLFYNAVVKVRADCSVWDLLSACQEIERQLGKAIVIPKGPRTVDLDLLFYGSLILNEPTLSLPHPALALRHFVLIPLSEIAPDFIHPGLGQSVAQLSYQLPHHSRVEKRFEAGWQRV